MANQNRILKAGIIFILVFLNLFLNAQINNNINGEHSRTIDSLKHELKITHQDTVKLRILNAMIEAEYDVKIWPLYNNEMKALAEKLIAEKPSDLIFKTAKQYLASAQNNIGYFFNQQGNIKKAIDCYNKSLKIFEEILERSGNPNSKAYREVQKGMAACFNNIGFIYQNQDDIPKALEYFNKSLKIFDEIGDKNGMASSLINIGLFYDNLASVVEEERKSGQDFVLSDSLMKKALDYYDKSLKIFNEIDNKEGMAYAYNNIGFIYGKQGDISKELEYFNQSFKIVEEINDKKGMAISFNNIGWVYFKKKDMSSAEKYAEKAYKLSKELGFPENIERAAGLLKKINEIQGNYKKAFEYYQETILMRDSIVNKENYKKVQKQQAKYEYEKQAASDSIAHIKAIETKNMEVKKQKTVIGFIALGLFLVLVIAVIIFRSLRITRKQKNIIEQQKLLVDEKNILLNKQKEEIEVQRDLVTHQKEQIEEIYQEVTDSINYAKRIQQAMLPNLVEILSPKHQIPPCLPAYRTGRPAGRNTKIQGGLGLGACLPTGQAGNLKFESFILFNPKNVVSGDFYWATQVNELLIVTVADCTGHGVPGAFMSMLGISFLNEIILKKEITNASQILNDLRNSVIEALKQHGESGEQKDGMDIALVVINTTTLEMQFAGANNPCYIIKQFDNLPAGRQGLKMNQFENETTNSLPNLIEPIIELASREHVELVEIKGDKQPIGIHTNMQPFTNQIYQLQKGETIYLKSDGFEDQFGGSNRKKFLAKNLKQLLTASFLLPMVDQKKILETTITEWIGKGEQIDDITVMGIKI